VITTRQPVDRAGRAVSQRRYDTILPSGLDAIHKHFFVQYLDAPPPQADSPDVLQAVQRACYRDPRLSGIGSYHLMSGRNNSHLIAIILPCFSQERQQEPRNLPGSIAKSSLIKLLNKALDFLIGLSDRDTGEFRLADTPFQKFGIAHHRCFTHFNRNSADSCKILGVFTPRQAKYVTDYTSRLAVEHKPFGAVAVKYRESYQPLGYDIDARWVRIYIPYKTKWLEMNDPAALRDI
jgi:hypothetical protein